MTVQKNSLSLLSVDEVTRSENGRKWKRHCFAEIINGVVSEQMDSIYHFINILQTF